MSAVYSGSTDRMVKSGWAAIQDLYPLTMWGWVNPSSIASASSRNIFSGRSLATGIGPSGKFASNNLGDIRIFANGGTSLNYITNDTPLAIVNRWYFLGFVVSFTAGASHIYVGRKGVPLVESTYGTATDGVSPSAEGDGCFTAGSQQPSPSNQFPGRIGPHGLHSGALTKAQLDEIAVNFWRAPVIGTCLGMWRPGYNNDMSAAQVDLSGNGNDLTVTGCTVGDDGNVLMSPGGLYLP